MPIEKPHWYSRWFSHEVLHLDFIVGYCQLPCLIAWGYIQHSFLCKLKLRFWEAAYLQWLSNKADPKKADWMIITSPDLAHIPIFDGNILKRSPFSPAMRFYKRILGCKGVLSQFGNIPINESLIYSVSYTHESLITSCPNKSFIRCGWLLIPIYAEIFDKSPHARSEFSRPFCAF